MGNTHTFDILPPQSPSSPIERVALMIMDKMLDQNCKKAQRLRDSYLMALSICEGPSNPELTAFEEAQRVAEARANLVNARNRYWLHVNSHGCRTKSQVLQFPKIAAAGHW